MCERIYVKLRVAKDSWVKLPFTVEGKEGKEYIRFRKKKVYLSELTKDYDGSYIF